MPFFDFDDTFSLHILDMIGQDDSNCHCDFEEKENEEQKTENNDNDNDQFPSLAGGKRKLDGHAEPEEDRQEDDDDEFMEEEEDEEEEDYHERENEENEEDEDDDDDDDDDDDGDTKFNEGEFTHTPLTSLHHPHEPHLEIQKQQKQNKSKAKKIPRKKVSKIGYSGTNLTNDFLSGMPNDQLLVNATQELGELISLHKSDDSMRFVYGFHLPHLEIQPTLTLTVIKGSIYTILWSTIARYDDEYLLELKGVNDSETTLVWLMKGYIHQNFDVERSELDWNKMKLLQDILQLNYIGVYSFAKLVSQYVLCLPLCEREGRRLNPMPATIMMKNLFQTTFPVELIGFQPNEIMTNPELLELIYEFVDVDGRGVCFPMQLLKPQCTNIDQNTSLRVVEIRKLGPNFNNKGSLAVVYGTCCSSVLHQRYVSVDIYELRQDLTNTSNGPPLLVTLLNEQEWKLSSYSNLRGELELEQFPSSHFVHEQQSTPPDPLLYSSEISFVCDSYWGSTAYHQYIHKSDLPSSSFGHNEIVPCTSSSSSSASSVSMAITKSSSFSTATATTTTPPNFFLNSTRPPLRGDNKWLVGDVVYIPSSLWFESELLYAYPSSVKIFLIAYITKRTPKQVTLSIPSVNRVVLRGFSFMEKTFSIREQDWIVLTTIEEVESYFGIK